MLTPTLSLATSYFSHISCRKFYSHSRYLLLATFRELIKNADLGIGQYVSCVNLNIWLGLRFHPNTIMHSNSWAPEEIQFPNFRITKKACTVVENPEHIFGSTVIEFPMPSPNIICKLCSESMLVSYSPI